MKSGLFKKEHTIVTSPPQKSIITTKHRVEHVPKVNYASGDRLTLTLNVEWKRVYVLKDNLWSKARMENKEKQ